MFELDVTAMSGNKSRMELFGPGMQRAEEGAFSYNKNKNKINKKIRKDQGDTRRKRLNAGHNNPK